MPWRSRAPAPTAPPPDKPGRHRGSGERRWPDQHHPALAVGTVEGPTTTDRHGDSRTDAEQDDPPRTMPRLTPEPADPLEAVTAGGSAVAWDPPETGTGRESGCVRREVDGGRSDGEGLLTAVTAIRRDGRGGDVEGGLGDRVGDREEPVRVEGSRTWIERDRGHRARTRHERRVGLRDGEGDESVAPLAGSWGCSLTSK